MQSTPSPSSRVLAQGQFLRLMNAHGWEYVERCQTTGVVTIVALTRSSKLILVEQFRPPVQRRVVELPAGLAGDIQGQEQEDLEAAARRELLEETGYEAGRMELLTVGPTSAGLSNEVVAFFRARGVKKTSAGGGDSSEDIQVHEVPLAQVPNWLRGKAAEHVLIDPKIYAALHFLATR